MIIFPMPRMRFFAVLLLSLPGLALSAEHHDFTIAVLPDTQTYTSKYPGLLAAQMDWIVGNRESENIVYVAQLGDLRNGTGNCSPQLVNHYQYGVVSEWEIVNREFGKLDVADIAYGVSPGNHDFEAPEGGGTECADLQDETDSFAPLASYENHFGLSDGPGPLSNPPYADPGRQDIPYYGDQPLLNLPADPPYRGNRVVSSNRDNYALFESNGVKFIAIHLAYRQDGNPDDVLNTDGNVLVDNSPELTWADGLLQRYPDRIAIVTSHFFMECNRVTVASLTTRCGSPATQPLNFNGAYGANVYDRLKRNRNLFLMMGGHESGEAYRRETRVGLEQPGEAPMQPVHIMLSNYQRHKYPLSPTNAGTETEATFRTIRGDHDGDAGFMRALRFNVTERVVEFKTFAPANPEIPATEASGGGKAIGRIRPKDELVSLYDVTAMLENNTFDNDSFDGMNTHTASNFSLSFDGYVDPATVNGFVLTFQSTVTAVFNQGGGLPSGIAMEDSVTFSATIPADAAPASAIFDNCFFDTVDCEAVAWSFPPTTYTLTYSSGYVQTGSIDRVQFENGGTEVEDDFSFEWQDNVTFFDGFNDIYQVFNHRGDAFDAPIPTDFATAVDDIDRAGLFDRTHYWGDWGNWGTYHYDYVRPQDTTVVTLTNSVP